MGDKTGDDDTGNTCDKGKQAPAKAMTLRDAATRQGPAPCPLRPSRWSLSFAMPFAGSVALDPGLRPSHGVRAGRRCAPVAGGHVYAHSRRA